MPATILIVEDEQDLVAPMCFALEREGYTTLSVERGDTALSVLQAATRAPDLVLLDRMLPDMSGVDVLRDLRSRAERVPVIMISASGDALDPGALGLDGYLTKPFRMSDLLRQIRQILGG